MKKITIAGVKVNALTKDDLVEITPDIAKKLLMQANDNFRRVSPNEVTRYAKSMKQGKWQFNGDTIGIDKDGKMKDGQHRTHAVVQTKKSLFIFPVLIHDDSTIDNKKRLEFEDVLTSLGYKNTRNLASVVKLYYRYANKYKNYISVAQSIENNTALEFLNSNTDLLESFNYTTNYRKKAGVSHSILAFLYHVMKSKNAFMAKKFIEILDMPVEEYESLGLRNYDAMYQYKLWLRGTSNNPSPVVVRVAMLIKVWNHWRTNTHAPSLNWRSVGPKPEEFPEIM